MKLTISPSSGYANSYFDVKVSVGFEQPFSGLVTISNETSQEQLDILSTSHGIILEDKKIKLVNTFEVAFHINLFSGDKLNKNLHIYDSVQLKVHTHENNGFIQSQEVNFYNESSSADKDVIPFEIYAEETILYPDKPIILHITSTEERKFELCMQSSLQSLKKFTFEIVAKKGLTDIHIPHELYKWNLHDKSWHKKTYTLFYVKFEGIHYSRIANRVYIPIPNLSFTINDSPHTLMPQKKVNPHGHQLDGNRFVLSDRFFVPCLKEHSGFGGKTEYPKDKLLNMTMFIHESQHIKMLQERIVTMNKSNSSDTSSSSIKQTHREMQANRLASNVKILQPKITREKFAFFNTIAQFGIEKPINDPMTKSTINSSEKVSTFQSGDKPQKQCLPCSRRKSQNAAS